MSAIIFTTRQIARGCAIWLALWVSVVAGSAFADEAALRAENIVLRAEVARLQRMIEDRGASVCNGDSGGPMLGSQGGGELTLLRKLARQGAGHVEQALGLAAGPLIIPDEILGSVVPNEYIFLTDVEVQTAVDAAALIGVSEAQITHVFTRAINGFSARLSLVERDQAEAAAGIVGVVQNGYIFSSGVAQNMPRLKSIGGPVLAQQTAEPSVDVYLFDTGIRSAHRDLQGRVADQGFSFFDNGIAGEDCSGHGTHVAARIAGRTLGVSGSAQLISVKVIDRFGTGDVATVIAGIDWVLGQPGETKLVNMSLTRLVTQSPSVLDLAVQSLIDEGAIVVVAAGNAAADAADYTPARVLGAITVGSATDAGLSDFSNAGVDVDIYASGEAVSSASIRDVCGVQEMSGTSMAAPVVTGLIAEMLAQNVLKRDVLLALKAQSTQVKTGAFAGEVTRYILPDDVNVDLLPCAQ